jgi:sec-independent protein translocase protein TatA
MIGDLFDSPWKILIVAVVLIVLFGSKKLPDAARSMGRSMRILKSEVQGMHNDEEEKAAATSAALPKTADQQQIEQLQQQIHNLQAQQQEQPATMSGVPEAGKTQSF